MTRPRRRCRTMDGRHAERYLRARGLARCRFAALRFHPALRYREDASVRRLPALVATVTGSDETIAGVQRTWLDARPPTWMRAIVNLRNEPRLEPEVTVEKADSGPDAAVVRFRFRLRYDSAGAMFRPRSRPRSHGPLPPAGPQGTPSICARP